MNRQGLLLVGSPRGRRSTSYALGIYLFKQVAKQGVATNILELYTALDTAHGREELAWQADQANVLVLSCPLYVESLPAPVWSYWPGKVCKIKTLPPSLTAAIPNPFTTRWL